MKRFLVILLALVLLFAAVSCNNEPEKNPTIPPAPGAIPAEPNSDTELKTFGDSEKKVLSDMYADIMQVLSVFMGGDSPKDISRDPTAGPALEASGKITLSGKAGLTAEIIADEGGVFFKTETETLTAGINVLTGEGEIKLIDGETERVVTITEEDDEYVLSLDGVVLIDDENDDEDEYDQLMAELIPAGLELLSNLSESTIQISDVKVTFMGIKVTANGEATLDIKLKENAFSFDDEEFRLSPMTMMTEGEFVIEKLNVTIEYLGASCKLEIENLSYSIKDIVLDDEGGLSKFNGSLSFKEIGLYAGYKDDENVIEATFEAMDASLSVAFDDSKKPDVVIRAKADIGLGLLVNENSIGVVIGVGVDSSKMTGEDPMAGIEIAPKAVVINGYFFEPEEFIAFVMQMVEGGGGEDPIL